MTFLRFFNKNKVKRAATFGFFELFRYAEKWDYVMITFGIIFTAIKSFGLPLFLISYGELSTMLVDRTYRIGTTSPTNLLPLFGGGNVLTNATEEENRAEILNDATAYGIVMGIISVTHFIVGIGAVDMFNYAALRQVTRMRRAYFRSLLRQNIGWFDVTKDTNFAVRIAEDIDKIRTGIGERLSHYLLLIFGFILFITMSFLYGWELTLVVVGYVPIIFITNLVISKVQVRLTVQESSDLAVAGTAAEEVLGGIRTVKAFSGERTELRRYDSLLRPVKRVATRRGLYSGIADGIMRGIFNASMGLAYWYGVRLVMRGRGSETPEYTPANLMITLFGLIFGADSIAKTTPFLESFSAAKGAATAIFGTIDRRSEIDSLSDGGVIPGGSVRGDIEFKDVHFSYPARKEIKILNGLSLSIKTGQTVALVGSSGNGKSTCMQLLQRFYDPERGQISIDGHDIRNVRISWLRQNLAVVGQEPVLFATTIEENIRYGKPDATLMEVRQAAVDAGAHSFIEKLNEGYKTMVGERGSQLSGGQKQRIAIARALIQNPKILLLDEATSALDSQSEKLVQETLDRASKGRTTLVVSHRQSAIKSADRIVFLEKGQIKEDGTHEELIKQQGAYFKMMRMTHEENDTKDHSSLNFDGSNTEPIVTEKMEEYDNTPNDNLQNGSTDTIEDPKESIQVFSILKRILGIARNEWSFIFLASAASIIIGASFPVFSILFGEFYAALSMVDTAEALDRGSLISYAVLGLAAVIALCAFLQTYLFIKTGVNLTTRIRSSIFAAMIRQDASWYDDPRNSIGALSVRLTNDAASVQGAIGYPVSGIIQSMSQFVLGTVLAFYYVWKMALVLLPITPLVVITVLIEAKSTANTAATEAAGIETITKLATEAIGNIRTVASLRQEQPVYERFGEQLDRLQTVLMRRLSMRGVINSLGSSITLVGYTLSLWYGSLLVATEGVPFQSVIKVSECSLYGTMVLGQALALAPAFTAAFIASHRIFKLTDRQPSIKSPTLPPSKQPDPSGAVNFAAVQFAYPTRPNVPVLRSLNLDVADGQTVALVGASGCGKSTCMQLLQRMYDPDAGRIRLGADDIADDIRIEDLRSKLSIVSQEPTLFDRTIAENIAYGESVRRIEMVDIIGAAKQANIHEFIAALPEGYETRLGLNGGQLSGGQKQRIAIARALVRNPKVLLLDEATSALDLHSEQVVQQALDRASAGRTCLVIAHRLSMVQNADVICVFERGQVVEQGRHAELIRSGGLYARLYNTQPKMGTDV